VIASILIALATFLIFTAGLGNTLTASKLWTTMSLFAVLQLEIAKFFPLALEARAECAISMRRMREYLLLDETPSERALEDKPTGTATLVENPIQKSAVAATAVDTGIVARDLTCSWGSGASGKAGSSSTDAPAVTLSNINFTAASGKLTMIAGPVSCGKSSLLQAILGELPATSGEVKIGTGGRVPTIAYVSQTPWILTATFRENITFSLPFDQEKYDRVIDACCLKEDVEMLPNGDMTMQGEKGVSLSGGQRSRLALARACYLDADVFVIDDVLAAVDARVGRRIFRKCIADGGFLGGKTRIMALHQLQYLRSADSIAVMSNGRMITQGTFDDLSRALAAERRSHHGKDKSEGSGGNNSLGAALSDILLAAGDHGHHRTSSRSRGSSIASDGLARSVVGDEEDELESLAAELAGEDEDEDAAAGTEKQDKVSELPRAALTVSVPAEVNVAVGGTMTALATPSVYGSSASSYTSAGPVARAAEETAASNESATGKDAVTGVAAAGAVFFPSEDRGFSAVPDSSPASPTSPTSPASAPVAPAPAAAKAQAPVATSLIQAEKVSTGTVSLDTYKRYFEASGGWLHFLYLNVLVFGGAALFLYANVFLSTWSQTDPVTQTQSYYPRTFGILVAASLVVSIWRAAAFFLACVAASQELHDASFTHVLKARLSFFDSNPSGRILNRLSKDIGILDDLLPATLFDFLSAASTVLAIVVLIVVVNPWVLLSLPPLLIALWFLQSFYVLSSRQIKRIEGVTRSPIFSLLNESLNGLAVIRAFKLQPLLFERMLAAIDQNEKAYFVFLGISRWLGARLDGLCVVLYAVVCFACIALRSNISASLIGLLLSQTATLVSGVQWTVRQKIETETQFTSVERVLEYCELETEELDVTTTEPSAERKATETTIAMAPKWPSAGALTINDLWMCYRPELPPVLRGLTATIPPGTFVGIVGRTGAGKSSLLGALLRLVEPERHPLRKDLLERVGNTGPSSGIKNADGHCGIAIDGRDISTIPLTQLRRGVSVIPQEPTLYSGTVRFNLSPFGEHTDEEIITALKRSQLWDRQFANQGGLEFQIKEGGSNLSVGARQLLCLSRAILRHSSLLLLDEASANIDEDTDAAIQATLRSAFKGSTVLVVAHRLNTVSSADLILNLSEGRAVELEHPHVLLNVRKAGHFYDLAQELGPEGFKLVSDDARKAWEAKHGDGNTAAGAGAEAHE
jgi:ATP-binding cassette, subfamily C (CFTR/MRP), member 1